ncbi:MAG: lysophospholipid acyltransferase family protein [Eubacteriales bacterium]|nr:lysophospholipid acyltransferase family protein [Eubacteriales bacterium]
MIRFIIVCITVVGFLILSIPLLLVEWIIGRFHPYARDISSLRIIQAVFRFILWETGAKIEVIGFENVPKDQTVLYVGNHRSYFDILLTYCRCPGLTGYVAKDSMEKIPLLSIWMKRLYCLFLNRQDIRQGLKTILTGIEQMKNGISMCIFPEGTRNKGTEMMPFKEGSLKMAEKTGYPIIPIAITNSAGIFENQYPKIRPAHVILEYGKPIYPKELSREDKKFLGAYTQRAIAQMLEQHTQRTSSKK